MTVSSEANRSGPYFGNGSTTVFPYQFRILNAAHIKVVKTDANGVETVLTVGLDYSVAGVGDDDGGTITTVVVPQAGETITNIRNVPFTQETDLENQGPYYADTVEAALDLAAMRDQQLAEQLSRAIKMPVHNDPGNLDEFLAALQGLSKRLLAPRAADPIARDDGSPLQLGDEYFNTSSDERRFYTNTGWRAVTSLLDPEEIASEAEATAGDFNDKIMTPLRTEQAIQNGPFFLQDGVGALSRSFTSKARDFVSVTDFGAVGDGVADDTAAIQGALSSGAKAVHVPAGTYIISATLSFPSGGTTLYGDGMEISTIKLASAGGLYVFNIQSLPGILIRDLTLDANNNAAAIVFNNSPRSKLHRVGAKNTTSTAIGMGQSGGDGCHYSEVIGCRIENTGNHAIYISLSNYVRVNDNFAYNIAWSGVDIAGGTLCTVNNNVLNGVGGVGVGSGFGGIRISNQCFNCSITGNTVSGFSRGIMLIGANYCTFASNSLSRCNAQGIFVSAAVLGGGTQANYNTIIGNAVYDIGIDYDTSGIQYDGILFNNEHGTTNCSGNVTIGNTIVNGFGSRMRQALEDTTNGVNVFANNVTNGTLGP